MKSNILFFDNIRSAHNVGSMFRIADTVGITEIFLAGITPDPIDRFGRPVGEITKTALGAEKTISWKHTQNSVETLQGLQQQGYTIIVLEQDPRAIDYKTLKTKKPFVFVVGNEVTGVTKDIIDLADSVIEIPLHGKKESLNVAIAAAVALFRILIV